MGLRVERRRGSRRRPSTDHPNTLPPTVGTRNAHTRLGCGDTLIIPAVGTLEIREYDQGWPDAFRDAAGLLRMALGESTDRIDHIGSTSVPGLASKDVIDIQVSVEHGTDLDSVARALEEAGWVWWRGVSSDHAVPGLPPNERVWRKVLLCEPPGYRRVNVHVRV